MKTIICLFILILTQFNSFGKTLDETIQDYNIVYRKFNQQKHKMKEVQKNQILNYKLSCENYNNVELIKCLIDTGSVFCKNQRDFSQEECSFFADITASLFYNRVYLNKKADIGDFYLTITSHAEDTKTVYKLAKPDCPTEEPTCLIENIKNFCFDYLFKIKGTNFITCISELFF